MMEFFDQVLGILESLWEIVSTFWTSIGLSFSFFSDVLPTLFTILSFFPTIISSACFACIAVMVAKFILGR